MRCQTLCIISFNLHRTPAAATAAKSLQSCPTLCDPIDGSPPGSSIHGIFQARVLEWGAIAFSVTEPLGGENFYSPIMYETCILNMLQQVG